MKYLYPNNPFNYLITFNYKYELLLGHVNLGIGILQTNIKK